MAPEKLLSILDIAEELKTGKATTKFMLKRFKNWLPYDLVDGQAFYHPDTTIKLLFIIQENLDMGMLPSKIEKKLDALCNVNPDDLSDKDIRLSNDGLTLFKSLFSDIGEQQKRIAIAHEKRAEVEERKAFAIEKRAEAEEKKAEAMNNIAAALQEMNKLRAIDPATRQIAHQAASIIVTDETDTIELDDLSLLLDETKEGDDKPEIKIDDLSKLIDEDLLISAESVPLDNLSLLLDTDAAADDIPKDRKPAEQPVVLDDLSALIDQNDNDLAIEPSIELDDLSKLIDDASNSGQIVQDMDDLSLLITDDALQMVQMDDLSKLIDDPEDAPDDTPVININISPEEDLGKYKAAIMKIIIKLKTDGLSVEDTTDRLNQNKIKTLSGKSKWGQKAISQIYKFIESAK